MRTKRLVQHFLIPALVLAFLLTGLSGCRKKAAAPAAVTPAAAPAEKSSQPPVEPPPQAITPNISVPPVSAPVETVNVPKAKPAPSSFEMGETNFKARNYAKAIKYYEDHLKANPDSPNNDAALFHLGLSLALTDNSGKNMRRSQDALKRLIAEFPQSPHKGPAEFILDLQSQVESLKADVAEKEAKIKLLSEELQKLKEIDLQRRPSRPPY
jgi:hypothetical protein